MFMTRQELAARWRVSIRTIDRLRGIGELRWVDIADGRGARPCVRFRLADILALESRLIKGAVSEVPRESQAQLLGRG